MAKRDNLLEGALLGAGLMYLLDPRQGRQRRAMARDQLVHAWTKLDDATDTAARDLRNRAQGVVAETRARFRDEDVELDVLEARVRSTLGRVVSHPHAVRVEAEGRRVTLSGLILEDEVEALLDAVRSVRGVDEVTDRLERHQSADDIPSLQGAGRSAPPRLDILQENWAPATRLLAGLGGGMVALYGRRIGGPLGAVVGLAGLGVLARAATNIDMKRLSGIQAERRGIDIRKSINVDAPVEEVFDFFRRFENFPRFMAHLRSVRSTGEGVWHWIAEGPAGTAFEWDAVTTEVVPNEVIAWKSLEGATIGNAGLVRFQPNEQGGTRLDIRMTYSPPGGAVGHLIASLFGVDPKHAMDEDLVRFKSLIEEGKTSAHGEEVLLEELVEAPPPPPTIPAAGVEAGAGPPGPPIPRAGAPGPDR